MNQFSVEISTFVGQGIGGILFRVLGAPMLFFIDGISYLFSAISEMFITIPQEFPEKSIKAKGIIADFIKDIKDGLGFIWKNHGM